MTTLVHLQERLFNRPHLVMEEKLVVIIGALAERFGVDVSGFDRAELNRFTGRQSDKGDYRITKEGIAIIPVLGTLVNRGAYTGAYSGLTSYEGIAKQLKDADKDSAVRGILLDMDTPGGEAGGAFEMPALIRDVGKRKPIWAYVNDMAASAGYLLASAASEIWTTRTGILGSIGVVMVHYDHGKRLENEGIKPTVLRAGKRKADVNPFGPMPKEARERLQAELDNMREMFVAEVVKGRPKLSPDDVRATEAGVFMGESAVEIGLADRIAGFDDVVEAMRGRLGKLPATAPGFSTRTRAAMSEPAAELNEADAVAAERQRIKSILGAGEADGRLELALSLIDTDIESEAAIAVLAKAPKAAPRAANKRVFYDAIAACGGDPRVASEDQASVAERSSFVATSEAHFKSQMQAGAGRR